MPSVVAADEADRGSIATTRAITAQAANQHAIDISETAWFRTAKKPQAFCISFIYPRPEESSSTNALDWTADGEMHHNATIEAVGASSNER